MIYITGDTHAEIDISKLSNRNWEESRGLTRNDYLIICGDFGFPFLPTDFSEIEPLSPDNRSSRRTYHYWMEWLASRNYTVLWVDGNHDNHKFWYKQPVSEWNGGLVNIHPLAPNVIHLKRGEYYSIDGYTFWTMGGARSHDKLARIPDISWWEEEIPSVYEMKYGLHNLYMHNNTVDFIITHAMPAVLQYPVCRCYYSSETTSEYLDKIYEETSFRYWFCGHYHEDIDSRKDKIRVLYKDIVPITDFI
ncbi:MAG: metallophosphoesterase [Oscillospiraceae bacterium]|nr:metallophosphoesterase [Oscillospiraceae bacterium]